MYSMNRIFIFLLLGIFAASCDTFHDDLPGCDNDMEIQFVYDYNIQRADMFGAHVGAVNVYVYDKEGECVASREESNDAGDGLDQSGYRMRFGLPDGEYTVVAVGQQVSQSAISSSSNSSKARLVLPSSGNSRSNSLKNFAINLQRRADGVVENGGEHLDTLWVGHVTHNFVANSETAKQPVVVSLVRDTKRILLSLHNLDSPNEINLEDYDVLITADNGTVNYDNSNPKDQELTYLPYASWLTQWNESSSQTATAHYEISMERIVLYSGDEASRNSRLIIINNKTGVEIADLNLGEVLQQGRGAYESRNYSAQEYLDREYTYNLDFFLKGDTWEYISLNVDNMAWSKRIQRATL
jgi:hypothetical protein